MKKAILVTLCLLTILGCSSLPERKNPDDTFLVIKVNRIFLDSANKVTTKPADFMPLHVYYITIDDDPKLYVIQQEYEQYTIANLSPGPHAITSIQFRLASSSIGKEGVTPVNIPFELKPGAITILKKAFTILIYNAQKSGYSSSKQFVDLKPAERTAIIDKLSASSSFATWELAD